MIKIHAAALPLAALALSLSAPASAADGQMVTATDPEAVAEAVRSTGYKAKLGTDNIGDPMIETAMGGWVVSILFYDCTENRDCQSLQFHSSFDSAKPMPAEKAIKWATSYRFGAVSIDEEGDPVLAWDVYTGSEGIPQAVFASAMGKYDSAVSSFGKMVFE